MIAKLKTKNTRELLLDAAEVLFANYGFKGTSIRAISQQSKFNSSLIKYYFGSKEGLYCELFSYRLKEFECALAHLASKKITAAEKLEQFLTIYMYRVMEYSHFHRLLTREMNVPVRPAIKQLIVESTDRNFKLVKDILELGKRLGEFEVDNINLAALHIFTLLPAVMGESAIVNSLFGYTLNEPLDRKTMVRPLLTHFLDKLQLKRTRPYQIRSL